MEYSKTSQIYAQLLLEAMSKSKYTWIRKIKVTPEPTDFVNMVQMRMWPDSDSLEECCMELFVYGGGEIWVRLERSMKVNPKDEFTLLRMLNLHNMENPYTPTSWQPRWSMISSTYEFRMDVRNMCSARKAVTMIDFFISQMHFRLKQWKNELPQAFTNVLPDENHLPNLLEEVGEVNVFEKYAKLFFVTYDAQGNLAEEWPEEKGEVIPDSERHLPKWDERLGDERALLEEIEGKKRVPTVSEAIGIAVAQERRRIRRARGEM